LQADNELSALRTSGVRFLRIARMPLYAGFFVFCLSFLINDKITPASVDLSTRTFYQIIYHTATLPIEPQFFRKDESTGRVFYVSDVAADQKTMQGVMIFDPARNSSFRQVTTAREATIEGQALVLHHADVIRFKADGTIEAEVPAETLTVGLPLGETATQFLASSNNDVYTLDSRHLKDQIATMQMTGQGGTALGFLKITLAQKISFPFASFIAVLIAIPLAVMFGKKGRSLGVALSIVVMFVYFLVMSAFVAFGKNGVLDPYVAAWIPNILMGMTGGYLFYREER
jgi:lipopolysaccharide export LptBFGC system permease protein LptF